MHAIHVPLLQWILPFHGSIRRPCALAEIVLRARWVGHTRDPFVRRRSHMLDTQIALRSEMVRLCQKRSYSGILSLDE